MKRTVLATLVAVLALTVGGGVGVSPSADASTGARAGASPARPKPVYWIDLFGYAAQHPRRVFFTADSGGYMKRIRWTHWGWRKTVAHGIFGSSAPCNPGQDCTPAPATMWLRRPVRCTPEFGPLEGKKVLVYRHARIAYPDFQGGTAHADISDRAGWQVCKQAR